MDVEFCQSISLHLYGFLSFNLLIGCITLIDLQILKNPCITGRDAHLVMMCDFLNMLLDSVCYNFAEDFCIYVYQ